MIFIKECLDKDFAVSIENYLFWNHGEVRSHKNDSVIGNIYSTDKFNYDGLKEMLTHFKNYKIWDVKTTLINGVYIECEEINFLIFNPHDNREMINENNFNQSLDSNLSRGIEEYGRLNSINRISSLDYMTFDSLIDAYVASLAMLFNLEFKEIEKLKALNTQRTIINNHRKLINGSMFEKNNHLEIFSNIYYCELYIISKLFDNFSSVIIHDVATNTAQLPLLISGLTLDEKFGVNYGKIVCSDIDLITPEVFISNCIEHNIVSDNNIELEYINLLEGDKKLRDADVIIANDVLEHLEENDSLKVFKNLWQNTKDVLIIHVPVEDEPNSSYGHLTVFNKKKFQKWLDCIENYENISDNFSAIKKYGCGMKYGFLILRKKDLN